MLSCKVSSMVIESHIAISVIQYTSLLFSRLEQSAYKITFHLHPFQAD